MAYTSDEVRRCWGFAQPLPSLLHLLHRGPAAQQPHRQHPSDHTSDNVDETYITQLESSHAFTSNACVAAMAEALGISSVTDSLAGSILTAHPAAAQSHVEIRPSSAALSSPSSHQHAPAASGNAAEAAARSKAAKEAVWHQVDAVWADEAVKRGVAYAKAGSYEHAFRCYDQALELNPSSTDALVARGAAHANQGQFRAAVADFEAALQHDPSNANAYKYLEATQRHMTAAGDGQQQEQQQQGREPRGVPGNRHAQQDRGGVVQAATDEAQRQAGRGLRADGRYGSPGSRSPLRRGRQHQQGGRDGLGGGRNSRSRSRSRSRGRSRGRSRSRERGRGRVSSGHGTWGRGRSRSRSMQRVQGRSHSRQQRRGRSRSSGSSSGGASTDTSSSSGHGVDGSKHLSLLDIQAAIDAVRSAKKERKRSRGSNKKHKKHKRSHGKHKHKKSKGRQ